MAQLVSYLLDQAAYSYQRFHTAEMTAAGAMKTLVWVVKWMLPPTVGGGFKYFQPKDGEKYFCYGSYFCQFQICFILSPQHVE